MALMTVDEKVVGIGCVQAAIRSSSSRSCSDEGPVAAFWAKCLRINARFSTDRSSPRFWAQLRIVWSTDSANSQFMFFAAISPTRSPVTRKFRSKLCAWSPINLAVSNDEWPLSMVLTIERPMPSKSPKRAWLSPSRLRSAERRCPKISEFDIVQSS